MLIDGFLDEDISDDELDDFWGSPSETASEPAAEAQATAPSSEPAAEQSIDAKQVNSPKPEEADESEVEAADIPGLEDILTETAEDSGEIIDERWEEVKGMLGLDSGADEFWEQAVAENLEAAEKAKDKSDSGILSYEEAKAKGLLGD